MINKDFASKKESGMLVPVEECPCSSYMEE